MAIAVQMKVHQPSHYSKLSEVIDIEYMVIYCNDFYDMIVFNDTVTDDLIEQIQNIFKNQSITYSTSEDDALNYVIVNSSCNSGTQKCLQHILKNHGIQVSPPLYIDEWEYHKFLCIQKSSLSKILKGLQKQFSIEVLSVREESAYNPMDFLGLRPSKIYENLSQNQIHMLVDAFKEGYYQIPRSTKLYKLAENNNQSRHTVERAIRNAERKVMEMVVPLIDFETSLQRMRFGLM